MAAFLRQDGATSGMTDLGQGGPLVVKASQMKRKFHNTQAARSIFCRKNCSCTGSRWATTSSIYTKKKKIKENGDNNDNNSTIHLPTQNAQRRSYFLSGEGDPDHRGPQVAADHQHAAEGGLLRRESPYKVKSNITTQTHIVILNTVLIAESCKVILIHTAAKPQVCLRGL